MMGGDALAHLAARKQWVSIVCRTAPLVPKQGEACRHFPVISTKPDEVGRTEKSINKARNNE